jgi:hypothetical protein
VEWVNPKREVKAKGTMSKMRRQGGYRNSSCAHTGRHVVSTTDPEIVADGLPSGKTKVSEDDAGAILIAEDIFWFQVAMKDAILMTEFNSVDDLEEHVGDEGVIMEETVCF